MHEHLVWSSRKCEIGIGHGVAIDTGPNSRSSMELAVWEPKLPTDVDYYWCVLMGDKAGSRPMRTMMADGYTETLDGAKRSALQAAGDIARGILQALEG